MPYVSFSVYRGMRFSRAWSGSGCKRRMTGRCVSRALGVGRSPTPCASWRGEWPVYIRRRSACASDAPPTASGPRRAVLACRYRIASFYGGLTQLRCQTPTPAHVSYKTGSMMARSLGRRPRYRSLSETDRAALDRHPPLLPRPLPLCRRFQRLALAVRQRLSARLAHVASNLQASVSCPSLA